MAVTFHTEDIHFNLKQKVLHKRWVKLWIENHGAISSEISFVFTSNKHLKLINQSYLNHNYYTDVITFDYCEGNIISGDVFISIEQVRINAEIYGTDAEEELRRVMIHGINHLLGYGDKTVEEKEGMRQMEKEALNLWLKMV